MRFPTFSNPDGSFFSESQAQPVRVVAPLTGATVTMTYKDNDLYINAAGTIATLTVLMTKSPDDGFDCDIYTKNTVTTITIKDGLGNAISTAPTTLTAGTAVVMRYINKSVGWIKWR